MTLAELQPGTSAIIHEINFEESFCKRCFAMGLRLGAPVVVIRQSPFNGPIQVRIGTTDLAIRKNLANLVKVL